MLRRARILALTPNTHCFGKSCLSSNFNEDFFVKRIRRIIFVLALLTAIVSIILLLNFAAPNPTGRRYSSRVPLSTGQGSSGQIGLDGERVLADDLHLPRNDAPDQLQCICNSPTVADLKTCRVCIVSAQLTAPYRRPDFVAPNFIAEAKNAQNLYIDSRDLVQITDYAIAARALNRPLWVFTRVNTNIDPEFLRIVDTTGGGVVQYFTVAGYVDPVDQAARTGLEASSLVTVLIVLWGRIAHWKPAVRPAIPRSRDDPLQRAMNAVEHTEKFAKDSKQLQRDRLD